MTAARSVNFDIERVSSIAIEALTGLKDRAGDPVYWHGSEMAWDLERAGKSTTTVAVALLHDVLEDSDWDAKRLVHELIHRGSSKLAEKAELIVQNVMVLTRRQGQETYDQYIDRIKESSDIATTVKIEDIRHHLKYSKNIPNSLIKRYVKALEKLTS